MSRSPLSNRLRSHAPHTNAPPPTLRLCRYPPPPLLPPPRVISTLFLPPPRRPTHPDPHPRPARHALTLHTLSPPPLPHSPHSPQPNPDPPPPPFNCFPYPPLPPPPPPVPPSALAPLSPLLPLFSPLCPTRTHTCDCFTSVAACSHCPACSDAAMARNSTPAASRCLAGVGASATAAGGGGGAAAGAWGQEVHTGQADVRQCIRQ